MYNPAPPAVGDIEGHSAPAVAPARNLAYADVLRTFAAVAVVMIHVSGQGVVHTELVSGFYRWVAIFFDAVSRWSVPGFVMVSGALLLNTSKQEDIGDFFLKRATRIGIPLVFWSAAFLIWRRYYVPEPDLTVPKMWRAVFYGIPSFHLYFLFLIAGLYLFTPMLRTFVRHASRAELWVTTSFALLLTTLSVQLRIIIGGWIQWTAFDYFVVYVGFFLAGHTIATARPSARWHPFLRVLAYVMLTISVAVAVIGVGYAKIPEGLDVSVEMYFQGPYPTTMVMTFCVFFIVFDLYRNPGPFRRRVASICAWIAPAAFGIYLIHPMFLWEIFKRHGMPVYPNTLIACPGWTLALFAVALMVTKIIQLIPGLRRIVG